jgi:1-phosphofructokinase family hexose kinase
LPELRPGEVLRVADVTILAGGKGVNVARAALVLGAPAVLIGFLPGHTGRAAAALAAEEGLTLEGIRVTGELRSSSILLEPSGRATVINEPGPTLGADEWLALETAVEAVLPDHGVLVCSGSLPPGIREDGYGVLTARAHEAGRRTVVDATGAVLAAALPARPDVVTPNLDEAEATLFGRTGEPVDAAPDARPRALDAAAELVRRGARAAAVTAGAAGAALVWDGPPAWYDAPTVDVVNPVGAGDVFTATLGLALERGAELPAAVREAVAAASAAVEHPLAGRLDPARMRALLA